MRAVKGNAFGILGAIFHRVLVIAAAAGMTLAFFLVLPLMQAISKPPTTDLILQSVDTAQLEAPDAPPEPEPEEESKEEETPPELTDEAPPLDLSQLELALNPSFGGGGFEGDFAVKLTTAEAGASVNELFSLADLDQKPRIMYQPGPMIGKEVRQKVPGTVYIIFIVDKQGRVENPIVQKSTDPIFDKPALNAVKQWKFEPGKRNGKSVRFRMRVPITFPESG